MEFASFYRDLGTDVTVIELLEQILPAEDRDISDFAANIFEKEGIKLLVNSKVNTIEIKKNKIHANIESNNGGNIHEVIDQVILAVGIVGNVENLGLEIEFIELRGYSKQNVCLLMNAVDLLLVTSFSVS